MTPQNFIIDGTVRTVRYPKLLQSSVWYRLLLVTAYSIPDAQHNEDQIYSGSDGCWSQLLDCRHDLASQNSCCLHNLELLFSLVVGSTSSEQMF